MQIGLGPSHIVRWERSSPPKGAQPHPQFSTHICRGQMAGWIKMPLGTKVGLGPGNIVFDVDPASPPRCKSSPIFGPWLLRPHGWMHQDATWFEGRLHPRPHCVTWGSSFPHKGHSLPIFGPCLVAKRSPISAAAEHLSFLKRHVLMCCRVVYSN